MSTLGRRLLQRAVPIGLATGLVGYVLCRFYLSTLQKFASIQVDHKPPSVGFQGPLVFGLIGFFVIAASECFRRPKKAESAKAPPQTPVSTTTR